MCRTLITLIVRSFTIFDRERKALNLNKFFFYFSTSDGFFFTF